MPIGRRSFATPPRQGLRPCISPKEEEKAAYTAPPSNRLINGASRWRAVLQDPHDLQTGRGIGRSRGGGVPSQHPVRVHFDSWNGLGFAGSFERLDQHALRRFRPIRADRQMAVLTDRDPALLH